MYIILIDFYVIKIIYFIGDIMIDFIKMQGTGNNYIYIDLISNNLKNIDFSDLSKKISDVNFGIGSDGLILICKSLVADAKMIIYNKDGSEAKMCGNGIRCVAKYLYDKLFLLNFTWSHFIDLISITSTFEK